jgi:hypothetical protein
MTEAADCGYQQATCMSLTAALTNPSNQPLARSTPQKRHKTADFIPIKSTKTSSLLIV